MFQNDKRFKTINVSNQRMFQNDKCSKSKNVSKRQILQNDKYFMFEKHVKIEQRYFGNI